MGGSSYSDDAARNLYSGRSSLRSSVGPAAAAAATFTVNSAPAMKTAGLDPATIKNGMREARDSDAHPRSNAIAIFFDVTGSMGEIPAHLALDEDKLPGLMRLIATNSYIEDPQVLFGAIGDGYSDQAPLQVGQFESGLEMDEWLTKLWREGNGGGTRRESYELAYYWARNHVAMDCWDKRGRKGYIFTMGDEMAYEELPARLIEKVCGDKVQGSMSLQQVLDAAQERFEVFHIYVNEGAYPDKAEHLEFWKKHLGERFLMLKDVSKIAELIGSTIGLCEGRGLDDVAGDLAKAGLDPSAAGAVKDALVPFAAARGANLAKVGTASGSLPVPAGAPGSASRI